MSESVVVVCDVCGAVAEEGVIIRAQGRNFAKDLCSKHLKEMLTGTHAPKRGRRPGSTSKRTTAKRTTAKRTSAKRTSAKRTRRAPAKRTARRRTRAKASA
jgi:uncharacterized protein with WD repeat